jgi:membrane fusion protein, copper/silver efflux system
VKKGPIILFAATFLILFFLSGSWHSSKTSHLSAQKNGKILYYVDPMHPAGKSDKPGITPYCDVKPEPPYAYGEVPGGGVAGNVEPMMPGSVKITPEKQQIIGVRVATVERQPVVHTLRVLGKVAPDENRTFRINASTELWIRKVYPPTTGSFVKKNEPLVAYYATNFLTAATSYMYALNTLDRQKAARMDSAAQLAITNEQIRQAIESLQNIGVSDVQIVEMAKTRKISDFVDVRSPSDGFVLTRNASPGQWIGPGTELYQIADLSRVWILADLFENETHYFRPGQKARVILPHQQRVFQATVSNVLPLFSATTRTMKVRLEVDNPGFVLRPDMFVDVELPIQLPPAVTIPSDAILDSGIKKTVFVDRGNGVFEPREVETGWRMGNQVEIVKGLEPGERVVISGTFLIDSESRLELAAQGMYTALTKDPVCGVEVAIRKADKAGLRVSHGGKTYYFHDEECKQKFEKDPRRYEKEMR